MPSLPLEIEGDGHKKCKQCTGISVLKRIKTNNSVFFFRFRKPERVAPWEGVLDGTKMPNTCVQVSKRRICFGGR